VIYHAEPTPFQYIRENLSLATAPRPESGTARDGLTCGIVGF
jgi:hypothetical protein